MRTNISLVSANIREEFASAANAGIEPTLPNAAPCTYVRLWAWPVFALQRIFGSFAISMRRSQTLYIVTAATVLFSMFLGIVFLLQTGLPSADVIAREAAQRPAIRVSDFNPGDVEIVRLNDLPVIVWRRSEADRKLAASQNYPEAWRHQSTQVLGHPAQVFADDANLTLDHEWFFALAKFPSELSYLLLRAGDYGGFLEGRYLAHFDLSGRILKGGGSENLTVINAKYIDDGKSIQLNLTGRP
ncbi:hypothetical protein [Actibacterium lipolyticum]|nr:hypothetical protein [Actibacterium lipolyticum]